MKLYHPQAPPNSAACSTPSSATDYKRRTPFCYPPSIAPTLNSITTNGNNERHVDPLRCVSRRCSRCRSASTRSTCFSSQTSSLTRSLVMAAKLSQSVAAAQLAASGITTSSSGGCTNRQQGSCTSLDQINDNTVKCMKALKAASGCALVITGGTVRPRRLSSPSSRAGACLSRRKSAIPRAPIRITMATRSTFHSPHASARSSRATTRRSEHVVMAQRNTSNRTATSTPRRAITGTSPSLVHAKACYGKAIQYTPVTSYI